MTYIEKRAAEGHYNHVERESWQPVTAQTHVVVPIAEQAIISFSLGLFVFVVFIVLGVALRYLGVPNIGRLMFWVAVWAGMLVGVFDFQHAIARRFSVARNTLVKRELMERESRRGTAASASTVRIEYLDPGSEEHPYGRLVCDELNTSYEVLAIACGADRLSKSILKSVGLGADVSLPLLTQMLDRKYIVYPKQNEPAQWTSKGIALKRAFTDQAPPLDMGE